MVRDEIAEIRRTNLPGVLSVEISSRRTYGRHTHDEYGIGVILDGAQDSASGRGQVRATKGQVITVNPNEVHDGIPLSGAPRHWRMLYFRPEIMASAFEGWMSLLERSSPIRFLTNRRRDPPFCPFTLRFRANMLPVLQSSAC